MNTRQAHPGSYSNHLAMKSYKLQQFPSGHQMWLLVAGKSLSSMIFPAWNKYPFRPGIFQLVFVWIPESRIFLDIIIISYDIIWYPILPWFFLKHVRTWWTTSMAQSLGPCRSWRFLASRPGRLMGRTMAMAMAMAHSCRRSMSFVVFPMFVDMCLIFDDFCFLGWLLHFMEGQYPNGSSTTDIRCQEVPTFTVRHRLHENFPWKLEIFATRTARTARTARRWRSWRPFGGEMKSNWCGCNLRGAGSCGIWFMVGGSAMHGALFFLLG